MNPIEMLLISSTITGNQAQARPQLLVFILPDKDTTTYGRIKRSAECRYGVVSQCLQVLHGIMTPTR